MASVAFARLSLSFRPALPGCRPCDQLSIPTKRQQLRPFSQRARFNKASEGKAQNTPPPREGHLNPASEEPVPVSHIKEIIMKAPRPVKIFVIVVFCILAGIETTFWINVARRYFSSPAETENADKPLSSVIDAELRKHILVGQAYERYRRPETKNKE